MSITMNILFLGKFELWEKEIKKPKEARSRWALMVFLDPEVHQVL